MKKLIYTLIFVIVATTFKTINVQAQGAYGVGSNVINLGVGFGYSEDYYGGFLGYTTSSTPVIAANYEHGVTKLGPGTLGLGVAVDYQGASATYSDGVGDTYKYHWTTTLFGIRGTYHPDFLVGDNYDVYGVLQLSYDYVGFSETAIGPHTAGYRGYGAGAGSAFYPYILVGGRYYFTDNIGAFAELGYDLSFFKIGLAVKLSKSGR